MLHQSSFSESESTLGRYQCVSYSKDCRSDGWVLLPAVGFEPQRRKFDSYAERVIPTFHQRAAPGLGTELTAVTLAGAWYSKSKLSTEASNDRVETVFTVTNSDPKRAALTN
eukprot:1137210-Rhodomonas_salina.1